MVTTPAATPVTTPPLTVAVAVDELLQAPPEVVSASVIVEPINTAELPEIAPTAGVAVTVMTCDTEVVPQLFVTV